MLAVSGRWAAALASNHTPLHRVAVCRTGATLISDLRIESAVISKDASATPRTVASVTVADIKPSTAQLLTPFGNRLQFYAGIRYPDNTTEMILIADLDIVAQSFSRPDATLTIECADPAARVAAAIRDGPIRPSYQITAINAIAWILARANYHGSGTVHIDPGLTDVSMASDWNIDGDQWDVIEQLCDSIGAECYFTPERYPVLRPVPTVKPTAAANLYSLAGGTVTAITSRLDRAPNLFYVYGAADDAGLVRRGLAYDSDPSSPTYINGAYGRVTMVENRSAPFPNATAAQAAAAALFARVQGRVRTVEIDAITNPALEPGDTVAVRFSNGVIERHVIQSVDIPLGAEDMHVTTRTTTYTTQGWP